MDISQPAKFDKNRDIEKNSNNIIIEYSKDLIKTVSDIVFGDQTLLLMIVITALIYFAIAFTIMTFK